MDKWAKTALTSRHMQSVQGYGRWPVGRAIAFSHRRPASGLAIGKMEIVLVELCRIGMFFLARIQGAKPSNDRRHRWLGLPVLWEPNGLPRNRGSGAMRLIEEYAVPANGGLAIR